MIQAPADLTLSCSISTALWLPNTRSENLLTVGCSSVPSCLLLGSIPDPGPGTGPEVAVAGAGATGGAASSPGVAPSPSPVVGRGSASMTPRSYTLGLPELAAPIRDPPAPPGVAARAARWARSGGVVGWNCWSAGQRGCVRRTLPRAARGLRGAPWRGPRESWTEQAGAGPSGSPPGRRRNQCSPYLEGLRAGRGLANSGGCVGGEGGETPLEPRKGRDLELMGFYSRAVREVEPPQVAGKPDVACTW